jgi:uncharacterized protein (DUF1778 family)
MAGNRPMNESRVTVRLAAEDRARFEVAAEREGESLAEFLVTSGRVRAERLLADQTTFAVDPVDYAAIMAAMERPPAVRPQLVGLFRRSRPE